MNYYVSVWPFYLDSVFFFPEDRTRCKKCHKAENQNILRCECLCTQIFAMRRKIELSIIGVAGNEPTGSGSLTFEFRAEIS